MYENKYNQGIFTISLKNSRIINQSSEFNSIFPRSVDTGYNHKLPKQKYYYISRLKITDNKNDDSFH